MLRSSSKSSLHKKCLNDKPFADHNRFFLSKVQTTLKQASKTLCYSQFYQLYIRIITAVFRKCEVESVDSVNLEFLKQIVNQYNPNLQLTARLILLEVKMSISQFSQENIALLNKVKHMVVDTDFEYILCKVFIVESKVYHRINHKQLQAKCLIKAVEFAQNFVLEYLNVKQTIRKQITQNIIIAYFELYKLKKDDSHKQAEEYLRKAYRTTEKNYGPQSQVTQLIRQLINDHKNISKGMEKSSHSVKQSLQQLKATTQIFCSQIKKDIRIEAFYLWQQEKILAQMLLKKQPEDSVISEAEYHIKLDMSKINLLRNANWVHVSRGQINIVEEEILKAIGVKQQNTMTTRIGIKNISKQLIIKKDTLSSSSEDASFIEKEDFNFIRRLGRAQSAKKQLNNDI